MLGAIIGDMVGSMYEFHPCKTKKFNIYDYRMRTTDDSYLTMAVAKVLKDNYPINYSKESLKKIQKELAKEFVRTFRNNMNCGFGAKFYDWCLASLDMCEIQPPYNSYGNGSAMRISPVGWIAKTEKELKTLSKTVTEITHNHPEGIKGAEAIALCIFMALRGYTKEEIGERMIKEYYPEIAGFCFENLVKTYEFSEICQKSVPQAIYCFLISNSLEDAIRNCVAIGGDVDTIGAMAGSIAEAYYQSDSLCDFEDKFLYLIVDPEVEDFVKKFHQTIGTGKFK